MIESVIGNIPLAVERKFAAPSRAREEALLILGHHCAPDNAHPFGRVRSLYLDSPALRSYAEKAAGDFLKRKVRIRWYDENQDPICCFLEIKYRAGGGRLKFRERLALPRGLLTSCPLESFPWREEILPRAGELRRRLPPDLEPALVLTYERHRFICPSSGARVCLDARIGADRFNARALPAAGPVELPQIVFEFKDAPGAEIPWLGDLARAGFRSRSFSKYAECIRRLIEGACPA